MIGPEIRALGGFTRIFLSVWQNWSSSAPGIVARGLDRASSFEETHSLVAGFSRVWDCWRRLDKDEGIWSVIILIALRIH
mmetsp:Transcript_42155/g.98354  ORF Transcript_42155/g.98354 Transcript_42155/m.98354 type:complete len:80 (+) Transcript_42155:1844-2083(+)